MFPNPSNGNLKIDFNIPLPDKSLKFSVKDLLGNNLATFYEICSHKIGLHTIRTELNNLPQGVYFVEAIYDNVKSIQKLILTK